MGQLVGSKIWSYVSYLIFGTVLFSDYFQVKVNFDPNKWDAMLIIIGRLAFVAFAFTKALLFIEEYIKELSERRKIDLQNKILKEQLKKLKDGSDS